MENTVLFNVIAYTGKEDRTATITVESGALMPLQMQITQTRFEGLIVTPTTLLFSNEQRTLSCTVMASADYEVASRRIPTTPSASRRPISALPLSPTRARAVWTCRAAPC